MKKKILFGLLVLVALFTITGCGKKITLDEIVEKFNNNETVKQYKNYGIELSSSATKDELTITTKNGEASSTVKFTLSGNILSNENIKTDDLLVTAMLIDVIGELQGYKSGELIKNMNAFSDEFKKYTVKSEGFELKTSDEKASLKIDLSKKIPLIDLSNFYLKTEQFEMIKEIVDEESVGNETGKVANLAYNVEVGYEENYIYIGEETKLTESAYKSILSALEVMYGKEIADNFKALYPSFKDGKTVVGAFTIDTKYQVEDPDESVFKDTIVVQVIIDNSKVK